MSDIAAARPLRRGWTTGACATAAARAAYDALLSGDFTDPVTIILPKGRQVAFALDGHGQDGEGTAWAAVIKDAGDDPDITHGARITARVTLRPEPGLGFHAGPGVGTVTRPGLPVAAGEPAINPGPRAMITDNLQQVATAHGRDLAARVEIGVDKGEVLAGKTLNPRLGIIGGLSILGTTGVVIPYSCAAWIASIHQAVDVARATGLNHLGAATGRTSEDALRHRFILPDEALIEMGDFAGGLLKYLRRHPLPRLTIAGGFAKLAKLAAGHLDLHSARSRLDPDWLATRLAELGAAPALLATARRMETGAEILALARSGNLPLGDRVAALAQQTARELAGPETTIQVLVVDRAGETVGWADG